VRREEDARAAVDVVVAMPQVGGGPAIDAESATIVEQIDRAHGNDLVVETAGGRVKLTNLDKPLWPATEGRPPRPKRELIRYYARVAPFLLPHLKDRPLTLTRYPNGIDGKSFYQKHWSQAFP
jgi:bifunctional non-homologous end joining protein LigD